MVPGGGSWASWASLARGCEVRASKSCRCAIPTLGLNALDCRAWCAAGRDALCAPSRVGKTNTNGLRHFKHNLTDEGEVALQVKLAQRRQKAVAVVVGDRTYLKLQWPLSASCSISRCCAQRQPSCPLERGQEDQKSLGIGSNVSPRCLRTVSEGWCGD